MKVPLHLYNSRLRYDIRHKFIYCENFKIASSTWAAHLLKLKHQKSHTRLGAPVREIHRKAKMAYPKLAGNRRKSLKENSTSFVIVRDPFERLLSAFNDKMVAHFTSTRPGWETFGKTQRIIRSKYRKKKRPGLKPTFEEFVAFLVGELHAGTKPMKKMTKNINDHWKPVYLNCSPCTERYFK